MLASLRCQTPSTRRFAPVPETRTPEKPNARNFLAISALSANRSTEFSARVAQYRFPWWTVKSPAKLALPKVAVIAKAAIAFSNMRKVLSVIVDVLLLLGAEILFGRPLAPLSFPRTLAARMRSERTLRFSMTWQKQALHGEISEPERISHPVHHKVQQLFADGYF